MANRAISYLKETRAEMKHVRWLSKKQTVNFTAIVIAISLAVAAFLGLFDFLFGYIIKTFVI